MIEPDIPKAKHLKDTAPLTDHQVIRAAIDKVISFIQKRPNNLRDPSSIQEIKESLLLLKGSMASIVH